MPITKELENLRKFESVGFTHEQAETLADVIELSHTDGQQNLMESIHNVIDDLWKELRGEFKDLRGEFKDLRSEFRDLRTEMDNRFKDIRTEMDNRFKDIHTEMDNNFKDVRNEIKTSELQIKASHTDLLIKIFGIIVGCASIAVAISKVWK